MRFEWDANNTAHIAAHGFTVEDAEDLVRLGFATAIQIRPLRFQTDVRVGVHCVRVVFNVCGAEPTLRVVTVHRVRCRRTNL